MTKNKSLYQILDDNHLVVTEELASKAKEEIHQSLLSLIGDNEYGNIGYVGEDMVDETTERMLYQNELRAELRTKVREWVNK